MGSRMITTRLTPLLRSRSPLLLLSSRQASTAAEEPVPPTITTPTTTYFDPELEPALAAFGYPKLSTESRQLRSPRGWWDPMERINFGEAVPIDDDVQSMWAPDVHSIDPFSAFSQLVTAFAAVGVFAVGVWFIRAPAPALPRAYPYGGLVQELSGTDDKLYAARSIEENEIAE